MNTYICNICRGSFRSSRALATHRATCLSEDIPRERPSSSRRNIAETRPATPISFPPEEAPLPSEHSLPSQPLNFHLPEINVDDLGDCFDEDLSELLYTQSSTYAYDSTYSLVQWIRMVKNTAGLSNSDIDKLFKNVLLHPQFRMENVTVKSAVDVQNYEKSYYREDDGWQSQEIQGYKLHHRDSLVALESLFSSPMNAENFDIKPTTKYDASGKRIYSTPATGVWWQLMQVSV